MGISFYTFQAIGYIVDVYRGTVDVEKNIVTYALFLSYFPQLVAGPIERSQNLLTQIKSLSQVSFWKLDRIKNGIWQVLWGLFLKMVIADRAAILVDCVFEEYYRFGTIELCVAAMVFAVQIYCDFCGYSITAQGCSEIIGIKLMDNFNTPYFARSIKEFWTRWHVSLSSWFKDYFYIPLGGSRCSTIKKYRNYFLTFLVSGIWHGASWNYIIWGVIHGVYQITGMITEPIRKKLLSRYNVRTKVFSYRFMQTVSTFLLVDFAWIFFRADSMTDASEYIKRIFTKWNPWALTDGRMFQMGLDGKDLFILIIAIIILFSADMLKYLKEEKIAMWIQKQNMWFEWLALYGLFFAIVLFGIYGPGLEGTQFVYFQF